MMFDKCKYGWLVVFMCGAFPITGMTSALPPLNIPLCEQPPLLDGKIEDAAWSRAEKINNLYLVNSDTPAPETTVWLMRDNAWLYIAAKCQNPQIAQLSRVAQAYGDSVNLDDSIEIFLHPDSDENTDYYHFMLSFANVVKEQRCNWQGLRDHGWNPPWRTATQLLADGWTAEIAIPLFIFADSDPAQMMINICRNIVTLGLDEHDAATKKSVRTWSTLRPDNKGGFHNFANLMPLAHLEGLESDASVFAPYIAGAAVTGTRRVKGRGFYDLMLALDSATDQAGAVRLQVFEDSGKGEVKTFEQPVNLAERSELELPVPTADLQARKIRVLLTDQADGRLLAQRIMGSVDLERVISKDQHPFFRKNFVPSARLATYVVAASDAADRVKAQADFICEGIDDHIVINAAIAMLPKSGGRVHLTAETLRWQRKYVSRHNIR